MSGVVHVRLPRFRAGIVLRDRPELAGTAFVVARPGQSRSRVMEASLPALARGIRPGMYLDRARALVPGLEVQEPSPGPEREAMVLLEEACLAFTPLVECLPDGQAWLDIRGGDRLFGPPATCAARIQGAVIESTGLVPGVCTAPGKSPAAMGSLLAGPGGFLEIPDHRAADFLAPQDIAILPGTGDRLRDYLSSLGFHCLGDLAALGDAEAQALLGTGGTILRDRARGIDPDPVIPSCDRPPSLSGSREPGSDSNDPALLRALALDLACDLGFLLRRRNLEARRADLCLDFADGLEKQAGTALAGRHRDDRDIMQALDHILPGLLERRVRVRKITLTLGQLGPSGTQLDLLVPPREARLEGLQQALDRARRRYGPGSLLPCAALPRGLA